MFQAASQKGAGAFFNLQIRSRGPEFKELARNVAMQVFACESTPLCMASVFRNLGMSKLFCMRIWLWRARSRLYRSRLTKMIFIFQHWIFNMYKMYALLHRFKFKCLRKTFDNLLAKKSTQMYQNVPSVITCFQMLGQSLSTFETNNKGSSYDLTIWQYVFSFDTKSCSKRFIRSK